MLNICDSRHRQYTELCNRSSSGGGSPQMGRAISRIPSYSFDTLEDYWEDASVSLRSYHSWEAPSCPWLGVGACTSHVIINEEEEDTKSTGLSSDQIRPHRNSCDFSEDLACIKGRRSFPPPLASCSTLSIKEGGRFVLKEMDAGRPHGFFRAQRGNGRLRLQLILPDEVNDEDGNNSSPVEGMVESRPEFFDEFGHVEYYANDEENIVRSNQDERGFCDEEDIKSNAVGGVGRRGFLDDGEGISRRSVSMVEDSDIRRPPMEEAQDVCLEGMEGNVCSMSQDVGMEAVCSTSDRLQGGGIKDSTPEGDRGLALDGCYSGEQHRDVSNGKKEAGFVELDNLLTLGKLERKQFGVESSTTIVQGDVFGQQQMEPIWNVDVSSQAMASLSPWSPKQMCLHQSIVNMRPALGLAMS